jgi:NAD(P)-dependent dehydrogenase (short-subunit alcohol dehydrogenase family)
MEQERRVAVITGATGALGRVVTKEALQENLKVISTYRSEETQTELRDFLGPLQKDLVSVKADVTAGKEVEALFAGAMERFGRIDILVNIVGAYKGGTEVQSTAEADWDAMMNVNLKSAFLCCRAALPFMIKQNYGRIVNVSSRTAVEKRYRTKSSAYAVSKAGVAVLTETIAEEVKKLDINVNAVLPSTMDTPQNRAGMPQADASKWVPPVEVAKVIMFLVSDDSKVTSGALVPVYGKA